MIQVHPRDYTMGFGGFLQGKFGGIGAGGINLQIRPIKGKRSDVAVHGEYKGPNFSSEFVAEFYLEHETKLKFLFHLKTPKKEENPFGEPCVKVHEKGLSRIIGEVKEEIQENGHNHHYLADCSIRRDTHNIGNMNNVYQDLIQYLVKNQLGVISGHIAKPYGIIKQ